jgi:putative MATE family efflux protein
MTTDTKTDKPLPYANKGDLTTGSIPRHLIRLSLPMVWGIFAIISFQLVDTFYIAMLGTEELAAITFTFPVTFTIFSVILGFGIAMSSVVSRQIGQGNQDTVKRITTHGLILAFITGVTLTALGLMFMDAIFVAMGADEVMLDMIDDYMIIWFFGAVCINLPMVGNAAIRAGGDSMLPAMIMTIAAVVNIILDPILIFGLLGFPRLELQGAAIATVFANGCAMLAGLYVLYFKKKMICRDGLHLGLLKDSAKRLVVIALPAGLTGLLTPLTNAVIISLLAGHGALAVAAFGAASRLEAFAFTVIMAVATGMAPIIGQNWGAGRFDRVNEVLKTALLFAFGWSVFVGLVFLLLAEQFGALFSKDNAPEFISVFALYFSIVALTYAPGNLVQGWGSAFNAMGMPKRSFMMVIVKLIVLQIPAALIGNHYFGIVGIFGAMAATNVVAGFGFHLLNRRICIHKERLNPPPKT